jgi:Spx/MgsR family transcriptional regulator
VTTIYGIKNCDTMKRAFAWLKNHDVAFEFHDYKKSGISAAILKSWAQQVGWEKFLNTRGTTWRKLLEDQRAEMNEEKSLHLMEQQPSLIKRPVIAHGKTLLVGFDEEAYGRLFNK